VDVAFLLTSFVVVITPGTGVLFTLAAGHSRGRRASVIAAFGCTLGIVPHLAAAILGLSALLYTSTFAFEVLKALGVAYLLYMAVRTLCDEGALRSRRVDRGVRPDDPAWIARVLELSGVSMAMTFAVFVGYGLFAAVVVALGVRLAIAEC
jgi:threonine/homoserine/homoserine lactone efflux protein